MNIFQDKKKKTTNIGEMIEHQNTLLAAPNSSELNE